MSSSWNFTREPPPARWRARAPAGVFSPASMPIGSRFSAGGSGHVAKSVYAHGRFDGTVEVDHRRAVRVGRRNAETAVRRVGRESARRVGEEHEQVPLPVTRERDQPEALAAQGELQVPGRVVDVPQPVHRRPDLGRPGRVERHETGLHPPPRIGHVDGRAVVGRQEGMVGATRTDDVVPAAPRDLDDAAVEAGRHPAPLRDHPELVPAGDDLALQREALIAGQLDDRAPRTGRPLPRQSRDPLRLGRPASADR